MTNFSAASSIFRGNQTSVTNLLSAFGGVKETSLSAMLGYLIHLNPKLAEQIFGIELPIRIVTLEASSASRSDRYDIFIENHKNQYLFEVKIGTHSPTQLHRYLEKTKNLIVIGNRLQTHLVNRKLHKKFYHWEQVSAGLQKSKSKGKNANHFYNGLVDDFTIHLKENNMIKGSVKDVYLRDVSGYSLEWYFNYDIYAGQAKFFDGSKNCRFLAPYLTKSNSTEFGHTLFKALGVGISFISKIQAPLLITPNDLYSVLLKRKWPRKEINLFYEDKKWRRNSNKDQAILLLGKPMRLFQRPVTKFDLWGVAGGAMPPMAVDIGDLVAASNGMFPLNTKKAKEKR